MTGIMVVHGVLNTDEDLRRVPRRCPCRLLHRFAGRGQEQACLILRMDECDSSQWLDARRLLVHLRFLVSILDDDRLRRYSAYRRRDSGPRHQNTLGYHHCLRLHLRRRVAVHHSAYLLLRRYCNPSCLADRVASGTNLLQRPGMKGWLLFYHLCRHHSQFHRDVWNARCRESLLGRFARCDGATFARLE